MPTTEGYEVTTPEAVEEEEYRDISGEIDGQTAHCMCRGHDDPIINTYDDQVSVFLMPRTNFWL